MRKTILSVIAFLVCNHLHLFAQQDAKQANDYIKQKLTYFLEESEIIPTENECKIGNNDSDNIKKEKNKKKKVRELFLRRYSLPSGFLDFSINTATNLSYKEMPLSALGSMLFDARSLPSDKKTIENRELQTLPIQDDLSQVSMIPSDNNYKLYITIGSLVNAGIKAGADIEVKDYLKSKLDIVLQKTFENKESVHIAYGRFENELAKLFETVRTKERLGLPEYKDFKPLLELWNIYTIPTNFDKPYYVIKDFTAFIVKRKKESIFFENTDLKSNADLKLSLPFLKLAGSANYD